MITSIKLHTTPFENEIKLENLRKINFFYGANGSGKTTITRVIANPNTYNSCYVEWYGNNKLKTIIYNEDFVRDYFYAKDSLSGIYKIGEGAKDIEEKIINKKSELDKLNDELQNLSGTKEKKEQEQNDLFEKFKETCWKKGYLDLQNDFDLFFIGYKGSKEKFANKILAEKSNSAELLDRIKLKEKYDLLYGSDVSKIDGLIFLDDKTIEKIKSLEDNQNILKFSIVGKKDIDIAKMIEKLHNHDWVKQGKEYYDQNIAEDGNYICPFCQQKTSEEFRKQLEEYFDETYDSNLSELNNYVKNYSDLAERVGEYFSEILLLSNKYIDEKKSIIKDKHDIIEGIINQNKQLLEKKQNNPSEKIEIKPYSNLVEEINVILTGIDKNIKEHNRLIDNKESEKQILNNGIWRFIFELLKSNVDTFVNENNNIEKAIKSISQQIQQKQQNITETTKEIGKLEKRIKSVKPTVDAINKILENFGFPGFKLKATEDEKHYQVIRNDGSDAKKTLSEGERNFLVFLYFYHFVYGVEDPEENINQDKVLVIDDPVSSFDSDVLFIVSMIIRKILDNIRKGEGTIKQVFILTHNAYFFKEITFISSRGSCYNPRNDTIYFIVRKNSNISIVDKYETCPLKTSYQLLWDDVKRNASDCISLQNSMRRIIEFYFKFLANIDENELIEKFEKEEQLICKSLFAWINASSHEIIDDYNISFSDEQIDKFKDVFKKIFEITGHIQHYNMMMGK